MDTWNPYDNVLPEALKITSLPNTIDRYMSEETGQACVHRLGGRQQPRRSADRDTKDKDDDNRQSVDKFCSFCGTHGHLKANCDFMAKLIIANASLKTVDAKSKEKLQESYRQEQEKRRNRKIKKRLGTIRKVMDEGGHLSDIEPLLDGLPDLIDHTNSDSDSESSDTETETNPHDNE
jgi:hypothetical protein